MGSLSITDIATGRVEVISGHMVAGELLNDLDYVLAGFPTTDDQIVPRQMGLPTHTPPSFYPLECEVCGDWAGDLILTATMSAEAMAAAAATVPNRLCPRHWQDRQWGRL